MVKHPLHVELLFAPREATAPVSSAAYDVHNAQSYIEARRALAKRLEGNDDAVQDPLRICVYGARLQSWFKDLVLLTDVVQVRYEGARAKLHAYWGFKPPSALRDTEINRLQLLERPSPPPSQVGRSLLAELYGPEWLGRPGPEHLASLLLSEAVADHTVLAHAPWLTTQREHCLREWAASARNDTHKKLYERLVPHERQFALHVASELALMGWAPYVLQRIASNLYGANPHLPEAVRKGAALIRKHAERDAEAIAPLGLRHAMPAIQRAWKDYLRSLVQDNEAGLETLVGTLEGQLPEELDVLIEVIKQHPKLRQSVLTESAYERLELLFGGEERLRSSLRTLKRCVLPAKPDDPPADLQEADELKEWEPWLSTYFPYRDALDRLDVDDEAYRLIETQAAAFSDWYIQRYPHLLRHSGDTVLTAGRRVYECLERKERVVWVIWDNLPAHQVTYVLAQFRQQGLHAAEPPTWKGALLPSVTSVSCKAILAGARPGEATEGDYEKLIATHFRETSFLFQNSLRDLSALFSKEADLYVVHFTTYDELLHRPDHKLSKTRDVSLEQHTQEITELLSEACHSLPGDRRWSLILTSDHGSTRLPPHIADSIKLPPGATNVEQYSSRAVMLDGNADYDPEIAHLLEPSATGLDQPVLLARGFRAFGPIRRGRGYVHGGALPEEVLVPLITLGREPMAVTTLQVDLPTDLQPLRLGRPSPLTFRVRNTNETPVRLRQITWQSQRGELPVTALHQDLAAGTSTSVQVTITLTREDAHGSTAFIQGKLKADVLGQGLTSDFAIRVPVRGGAITGADPDDIFDL